jgi:hypothetical protein
MLDLNNVEDLRALLHETCQHLPPDDTARRTHVAVAILEGARGGRYTTLGQGASGAIRTQTAPLTILARCLPNLSSISNRTSPALRR